MRLQFIALFLFMSVVMNGYAFATATQESVDTVVEQTADVVDVSESTQDSAATVGEQIPISEDDSLSAQDKDKPSTKIKPLNKNAEKCYKLGNRALKRGLKDMMQAKDSLNNLFMKENISIIDIRECFKGKDVVSFPEFFDGLYKKYKATEFREAKNTIVGGSYHELKKAISLFSEAIKHDPTFVDAFLARAMVYLEMGMNDEARVDLETARKIGFEKIVFIDVLGEEFENLCLNIAGLYLDGINLSDDDQQSNLMKSAEEVMNNFVEVRAVTTKQLILTEYTEEKKVMLMNQCFVDKFAMARCYMGKGHKAKADTEFNEVYEKLKSELDLYPEAKEQIDSLGYKITNMIGLATVRFEFEDDFKGLKPKVDIEFLKEERKPATVDDINIYLSDSKYEVRFKKDAAKQGISQGKFLIPSGYYTCNIWLSGLEILKKDRIPFAIEETKFYKDIFPSMQLKITPIKGSNPIVSTLPQDKYKINPDGTLYKGVTICDLEKGQCEVYMSISNKLNFIGGKEYTIRIKKAYNWKPYISMEIAKQIAKQIAIPGMVVLFLLLR
ncbi:MAG: tetratricopeptide repeat protein [Candidatus Desantisbacteria bacterium]